MCPSDAETLEKLVDKEKKKIEAEQEKKEDCDRKRIQAQQEKIRKKEECEEKKIL